MNFNEGDVFTYLTAIVTAVAGATFGLQKAMKMWSTDKKDIYKNTIETDLFHRLGEETKRLHDQNALLSTTIEHLRVELGKLHSEITNLRIENATMRQEVSLLHNELEHLRVASGVPSHIAAVSN